LDQSPYWILGGFLILALEILGEVIGARLERSTWSPTQPAGPVNGPTVTVDPTPVEAEDADWQAIITYLWEASGTGQKIIVINPATNTGQQQPGQKEGPGVRGVARRCRRSEKQQVQG